MELTTYEWMFVGEYLIDFNGTEAVKRARAIMNLEPTRYAGQESYRLLRSKNVKAEIERCINKIRDKTKLSVETIIHDAVAVLNADPRDLITLTRGACRYCHGRDHLCQYTEGEQKRRMKAHLASEDYILRGVPFDHEGGIGYDPIAEPHPGCPECNGQGIERMAMKDAYQLTPDAVKLLAGWKMTKNGLEVVMRSKDAARELLAKYQGMYKDIPGAVNVNLNVQLNNLAAMTDEELEKVARGDNPSTEDSV